MMGLADILAAPEPGPFRTGRVTSHSFGLTVMVSGTDVRGVPYIHGKPAVGSIVLLAYVEDRLVCLGPFGTDVTAPAPKHNPYNDTQQYTFSEPYNG